MNLFNNAYHENHHQDYGKLQNKIEKDEVSQIIIRTLPSSKFKEDSSFGQFSEIVFEGDIIWKHLTNKMVSFLRGIGFEIPTNGQIELIEDIDEISEEDESCRIHEPVFSGVEIPEIFEFIGESYMYDCHPIDDLCEPNFRLVNRLYNPSCFQDILDFIKNSLNQNGFIITGDLILVDPFANQKKIESDKEKLIYSPSKHFAFQKN
jgi:hypothetical protein